MKTNQNLIRRMGEFKVTQRTSDGMFNATTLLKQWNENSGQQKMIAHYFENDSTKEFISTISKREFPDTRNSDNGTLSMIYQKKKGGIERGSTYMHPLLFIDFAMWINPSFKYDVIKFVYDELIRYRNEAGDAYREMADSIQRIVPKKEVPVKISHVARAINHIVYNRHESELRNKQAEESKVKELAELERDIAKLINHRFITSFDQLINYLRRLWSEKYLPKELSPSKN